MSLKIFHTRRFAMKSIAVVLAASLLMFAAEASAQWATTRDSSIPRMPDGTPNLSGRAPKAPDGKVDLSGVWLADPDPKGTPGGVENLVLPRYFINITA